jgi:hypothetical protein
MMARVFCKAFTISFRKPQDILRPVTDPNAQP